MIRLIALFILVFAAAVIARTPLGFALDRSGLAAQGLTWGQAQGTIWQGRVSGLYLGAQPLGEATLKMSPLSLLSGKVRYTVQLSGPAGRASGVLAISGQQDFDVRDARAEVDVAALHGVADRIRETGGVFRLRADRLAFSDGRCAAAEGRISTDVLTRAAASIGKAWPEATGALRCEGDMLVAPLEGDGADGESVTALARVGFTEPSSVEARVAGADPDLENALALLGFATEGDVQTYRREAALRGRMP